MNTSHTETLSENKKFSFIEKFFKVQPEDNIGRLSFFLRILLAVVVMFLLCSISDYVFMVSQGLPRVPTYTYLTIRIKVFVIVFFLFRPLIIKRLRNMGYEAKIPNILLWIYFSLHVALWLIVSKIGESILDLMNPDLDFLHNLAIFMRSFVQFLF